MPTPTPPASNPEPAAAAARLLRDYQGSERPRFQLINTLLAIAATVLVAPMALGGWDRPIPVGLVEVGPGCLLLALGWLADFALRPLHIPTESRRLPITSVEDKR